MVFNVSKQNWRETGVYCIINLLNSKIYVGSTSTNFRQRYLQYCSGFRKDIRDQPVLYKAFKKYGFENFEFTVLCVCEKSKVLLMEQFYIDKGVDYNACLIAGSLEGYKHPKDSKTRIIRRGSHHCAVSVDMYSLKGKFLKSFECMGDAQQEIGIRSKSNITQCCKGKVFSAGGYRWAFKGDNLKDRSKREGGKCSITISKGNFSKSFPSQKEAAEYLKVRQGSISNTLRLNNKLYGFTIKKS